jgi:hypothetical protein
MDDHADKGDTPPLTRTGSPVTISPEWPHTFLARPLQNDSSVV